MSLLCLGYQKLLVFLSENLLVLLVSIKE